MKTLFISAFIIMLIVAVPVYGQGSGLIPCGIDNNNDGVVSGDEECGFDDLVSYSYNLMKKLNL